MTSHAGDVLAQLSVHGLAPQARARVHPRGGENERRRESKGGDEQRGGAEKLKLEDYYKE